MGKFYIRHYFDFTHAGEFLLVTLLALAVVMTIIVLAAKTRQNSMKKELEYEMDPDRYRHQIRNVRIQPYLLIESFYEMVFSSTSVLLFLAVYYLLDAYYVDRVTEFWKKYQNVVLLVMICLSVFVTAWLDTIFVKLRHLDPDQKAGVRLVSSLYIVLILLYIRFIYKDTNYNELILYFVTLAVGRFVFFDFTVEEFVKITKSIGRNLPLLLLMCAYSGFICWYGFRVDFLLTSNGVILSTFIAHIFMCFAIFVLSKTRILRFVVNKTNA
ncbi:MAG: hypothetical protein LKG40_05595 [Lachnospiraceae bacterium]|jgi:hypothetical protein|nr:hypothetical protein [Lachnospiraceae bacterium]MCI1327819.1 hypothetical protein [Lachnospiraceae bacterium]